MKERRYEWFVGCGCVAVLVVYVLLVVLFLLVLIPNVLYQPTGHARYRQTERNVDGIKTAQIAYHAAFDTYIAIPEPVPRPLDALDEQAVPWPEGTLFDTLGWEPSGHVRGTYWVVLSPDGQDFEVHGVCDTDDDDKLRHYIATRGQSATLITEPNEY
jgi:hypothetical protein